MRLIQIAFKALEAIPTSCSLFCSPKLAERRGTQKGGGATVGDSVLQKTDMALGQKWVSPNSLLVKRKNEQKHTKLWF